MLALVDADILLYRVGFSCENETRKTATETIDDYISVIVNGAVAWDYKLYLTDSRGNYRNKIYPEYKQNRVQPKPLHYSALKEYLILQHSAIVAEGQEADDALGIEQTILGDKSIILSIDKDLDMIPGWHYNFVKQNKYYVKPEEGIRHFYKQLLQGDRVDNIPGIKGIGPKKAEKILEDCNTVEEFEKVVLTTYKGYMKDSEDQEIRDYVQMLGQLLWIRRQEGEVWQLTEAG